MNKILKILATICIVSCLACLVACDQVDETDPTALKPFAAPNPNNPYDTKYPPVDMYGNRDNHYSGHLKLTFTNTESLNNLFHDFVPEDFPGLDIKQISDMTVYYRGVPGYEDGVSRLYLLRQQALLGDAYEGPVFKELKNYNRVIEIQFNFFDYDKLAEAYELLYPRPEVRALSPYYKGGLFETPNDTNYSSQQQNIADLIDLEEAWDHTSGSSSVQVGVIDSGIMCTHPDLIDNLDMAMGLELDPILENQFVDEDGHGTSVAGIIGAVGDNEIGISGVCWGVSLVSLKVAEAIPVGADTYNVLEDPEYLIQLLEYASEEDPEINKEVIPILSFSGGWYSDDITPDQIEELEAAIAAYPGLLVCAAGNSNIDLDAEGATKVYPACIDLPNILVVGATNDDGSLWASSNYGQTSVDIFAPGVTIYTTANSGSYTTITGTSAATPFVSGVAALLLSYDPTLTTAKLKSAILNGADTVASLSGKCVTGGRLNALNAIHKLGSNFENYTNISLHEGHSCTCAVCQHAQTEAHDWQPFKTVLKCSKCSAQSVRVPIPITPSKLNENIRMQLEDMTESNPEGFVLDIAEHVAIVYYRGEYCLIVECDDQMNELSVVPDWIFNDDVQLM